MKQHHKTLGYRLFGWGLLFLSLGLLSPVSVIIWELASIIEQGNDSK